MPDLHILSDKLEILDHGSGALEMRRGKNVIVIMGKHFQEFIDKLCEIEAKRNA
jgi:hypothetical protein